MSSSRRTGGEINILAMLDGKTPGMLSRRLLGLPRAFWYGVAAICVCLLVAALAWLVHTAMSIPAADSDEAALQPTPPAPLPTALEAPASAPVETSVTSGATIIDGASATIPTAHTTPSALAAAPMPALPVSTPPLLPHDTAAAPAPPRPAGESAVAVSTHAPSTKHPPHAAVRVTTSERKPAAPHASAGRAEAPSRTKRQASAAKPTPPAAFDTDVALISAIIQHTNAHPDPADAESDRTPPCTKPNCHARLPNRQ